MVCSVDSDPLKSRELTEEELKERQKKFETFLNRQQQILKRKEENVRVVRYYFLLYFGDFTS
jgi:hypothetical protein